MNSIFRVFDGNEDVFNHRGLMVERYGEDGFLFFFGISHEDSFLLPRWRHSLLP